MSKGLQKKVRICKGRFDVDLVRVRYCTYGCGQVSRALLAWASHQRRCKQRLYGSFYRGKAAVFLASDDASFVAGVELFVDGGSAQV